MNIKNTIEYIKKYTTLSISIVAVIFILMFLKQCNTNSSLKNEIANIEIENKRLTNNHNASLDSVETYKVKENTWRSKKKGYELSVDELKKEYSELLGDFKIEKNKPPITIIQTVAEIKESITDINVNVNDSTISFEDDTTYTGGNSRYISSTIPYHLEYNKIKVGDSVNISTKVITGKAKVDFKQEITLTTGLFKNLETGEIEILVDTEYPNLVIKDIQGAKIMENEESRKVARGFRKTWGLGVSFGYGATASTKDGRFVVGPTVNIGLTYQPKILQWGK